MLTAVMLPTDSIDSGNATTLPDLPLHRTPTEVSASCLIYAFSDMEQPERRGWDGNYWSPCQATVNRSTAFNARKMNFVLTVYVVWRGRESR